MIIAEAHAEEEEREHFLSFWLCLRQEKIRNIHAHELATHRTIVKFTLVVLGMDHFLFWGEGCGEGNEKSK